MTTPNVCVLWVSTPSTVDPDLYTPFVATQVAGGGGVCLCAAAWGAFVYNACRFTHRNTPVTHPSRQVLRQRLRQLILMRETGPKRPAWHLRRMQLIWGLHDALAALDGGLTPAFPQTLLAYGAASHDACERQVAELCALPVADVAAINARAEWIARWGRQRNWELTRWKDPHTADSIAFTILGKGGPRIVVVGTHHTADDAAAAGIVTALTAMAALEECGGLGDVGCITLLSAGDPAGRTRALLELCGKHTHVLVLGAHRDGSFGASHADAATHVLRACATALGIQSRDITHVPDEASMGGGLPTLRGFGPGPDRGIAATIALLALVCARLGTPS